MICPSKGVPGWNARPHHLTVFEYSSATRDFDRAAAAQALTAIAA